MTLHVDDISNDSIAAFFHGMGRGAYLAYLSTPPGLNLSPTIATEKYLKNTHYFFKHLHNSILIKSDIADSMELEHELILSEAVEFFTDNFFKICRVFDHGAIFSKTANRKFPLRPISEESYMMFFIGISWFLHTDTKNRTDVIMNFLKTVRAKLAPNMTNERLYELWHIAIGWEKLQDYRDVFFDKMKIIAVMRPPKNSTL